MIYEHRAYYTLPGKQQEFIEAFERIPMKVFARNGANLVGFWTTLIGQSNEVIYLLSYPNLAAREAAWAGINSDEEMAAYRAEGIRVHHIEVKMLRPASFSPLQ